MHQLIATAVIAFSLLLLAETLRTKGLLKLEVSRKVPHIAAGIGVALWPFFVSMELIALMGVIFIVAAATVRKLNLFDGVRSVNRLSWGEFFFPLGVIAIALLHPSKWIFAAAVLHLGIADAMAALIGTRFGKGNSYKIFGQTKSLAGSSAFFTVSLVITLWLTLIAPAGLHNAAVPIILLLPPLATGIENVSVFGTDNLFVPLAVTLVLLSF